MKKAMKLRTYRSGEVTQKQARAIGRYFNIKKSAAVRRAIAAMYEKISTSI